MSVTVKSLAAAVALLTTAACAGPDIEKLRTAPLQGDAFDRTLAREYLKFATFEAEKMDDWLDARHFARKGLRAARGLETAPERPVDWRLPAGETVKITAARKRLIKVLEAGARRSDANRAAIAQFGFDCWLEQQEENFQKDDIAACRDRFFTALDGLEKGSVKARVDGKPDTNAVLRESRYLVFFGHDDTVIGNSAARVIAAAADVAKQANTPSVVVAGHADRSGPDKYNTTLSQRRADAVRAALIRAGLRPERISVTAYGEASPIVPTKDGMREQRNRRAEIQLR